MSFFQYFAFYTLRHSVFLHTFSVMTFSSDFGAPLYRVEPIACEKVKGSDRTMTDTWTVLQWERTQKDANAPTSDLTTTEVDTTTTLQTGECYCFRRGAY